MKTGLFGMKSTFVPIWEAEVTGEDEVRVPFQKEQLDDAPNLDPDEPLSSDEERRLFEHYGRSDYDEWQGQDRTTALGLPEEEQRRFDREDEAPAGQAGDEPAIVAVRLRRYVVVR